MLLLNIGLIISLLRIRSRGKSFFKVDVLGASIPFRRHHHLLHPGDKILVSSHLHISTGA
jgi:hypothetical protein